MSSEVDKLFEPKLVATVKRITGFTPIELVSGLRSQIMNSSNDELMAMSARTPELAEPIAEVLIAKITDPEKYARWRGDAAKLKAAVEANKSLPTASSVVMQGDARRPKSPLDGSKHTGNRPYFDPNSDHMSQIDPLAPYYDLSGDFPTLVNPLAPGLKMPTNG